MAKTQAAAKFAFQCKHCGAVESAEAAGDNPVPGACHNCRHGVRYEMNSDGTGFTVVREPENWIILAELSQKDLAADFKRHGLTPDQVSEHKPKTSGPPEGGSHEATATERVGTKDKG